MEGVGMKTTIHPSELTFRTYCKVCEEWYQFKLAMDDFINAESAAEDTMHELGWRGGVCPNHPNQKQ
jgi:hypothetical protein